MHMRELVVGVLGALAMAAVGCSSHDEGPTASTEAPSTEGVGTAIEGCAGGLRLLPGDQVRVGDRTLDCGDLDQLLLDHTIDHVCLGAISKQGGRSCIERFVRVSRGHSPIMQKTPPIGPAVPEEAP